ncbi:hypothetical protein JG687_00008501, partial [Phytophthora cactorum]
MRQNVKRRHGVNADWLLALTFCQSTFTQKAINQGVSEGVWSREDLVVTAKIFSGIKGFR